MQCRHASLPRTTEFEERVESRMGSQWLCGGQGQTERTIVLGY